MPKKILKGFTLIELLVVVAIIGILSAIGVVAYSKYSSMAQTKAIKAQNYESLGSRAISGNACTNKGFNTWVLVVSKLPNDEFYFNCAGKVW